MNETTLHSVPVEFTGWVSQDRNLVHFISS
jgi:hypothetical protein